MKLVYFIRICCWQKNPRHRVGELFINILANYNK